MEWLSRFPVVIERKPRRSPRAVPVLPLRPIVRSSYLFPVSCLRRSASQILQTYTRAFLPNRQGPLEGGSVNDCFATALTSSSVRPPLSLSRTSLFCSCLGFFSFAPQVAAASSRERCVRWPRLTSGATCGTCDAYAAPLGKS